MTKNKKGEKLYLLKLINLIMKKMKNVISVGLAVMAPVCSMVPNTMQVFATEKAETKTAQNTKLDFNKLLNLPSVKMENSYDGKSYPVTMEKDVYPNHKFLSNWSNGGADIWEDSKFTPVSKKSDKFGNTFSVASKTKGEYTLIQTTAKDELENTVVTIRQITNSSNSSVVDTQYEIAPIVAFGSNDETVLEDITYKSYMKKLINYVADDAIAGHMLEKNYDSQGAVEKMKLTVTYNSGRQKVVETLVSGKNQVTEITITEPVSGATTVVAKQTYGITNGETVAQDTIDAKFRTLCSTWAKYLPTDVTSFTGDSVFNYDVSPSAYPRDERVNGVGVYDREGMNQIAIILRDAAFSVQTSQNVVDLDGRIAAAEKELASVLKNGELSEDEKNELAKAKQDAMDKISNCFNLEDYREAEADVISEIVEMAFANIEKATTPEECKRIADTAMKAIDEVKTDKELTEEEDKLMASAREKAKAEINAYIPWDDFKTESEKESLKNTYDEFCTEVDKATSEKEITQLVSDYKVFIDDLVKEMKEDAENKALKEAKEKAIKELSTYLEGKTYKEKEQKTIDTLVSSYTAKINDAKDVESIEKLVKEYKAKVDEVKTAETVEKEEAELAKQKEEAKKEIRKAVEGKEYRETQAKEVESLLSEYDKKIDGAKTKAELDAIVKEAITKLSAVKTDAQLKAEGNTDPTGKEDGTADSVKTSDVAPIAGLGVLGTIAAIAGFKFRKKND